MMFDWNLLSQRIKNELTGRKIESLTRLSVFGSLSYGDFIEGYSDLDIFAAFNQDESFQVLEDLLTIKQICFEIFKVKNIDITFVMEKELNSEIVLLNPLIYAEIQLGIPIIGDRLPDIYTPEELRWDGQNIAAIGLRGLRSLISKMYAPKPIMLLRSCDELLFKSTKALLAYTTGKLISSRPEIINALKLQFPELDISVYERVLKIRQEYKHHSHIKFDHCDELVFTALLIFEKIYHWRIGAKP